MRSLGCTARAPSRVRCRPARGPRGNSKNVMLAAAGLVPPWLAAIGMSASSLLIVLNALRVGREPALRA